MLNNSLARKIGFTLMLYFLAATPASAVNTPVRSDPVKPALSLPALSPQLLHNLAPLFHDLDKSSEVWTRLTNSQVKTLVVSRYIALYRQEGVFIRKPAAHYVKMVDAMIRQNPDLVYQPFKKLLRIAAIVEYDFDNGRDPDMMVRRVLGIAGYWKNRKRLGW